MTDFTPLSALIGGGLIGTAAVLLMAFNGRIAGISGIAGGLLLPRAGDAVWRVAFIAGLVAGPLVYALIAGALPQIAFPAPTPLLILGGLVVGFGTQMGGGCTSGHGVCGISRLSARSLVATVTFMVTGILTVAVVRHLLGIW